MSKLKKDGRDPLEHLKNAMESWEGGNSLPTFSLREISIEETLSLISKLGNSLLFWTRQP